jgi:hypothetical protein
MNPLNPNETWVNARGIWLWYVLLILISHLMLLSIPFLSTADVWTLTNVFHSVVSFFSVVVLTSRWNVASLSPLFLPLLAVHAAQTTFILLHWIKGAPFSTFDDDAHASATQWEQIDGGEQSTPTRNFFFCVPIVLCVPVPEDWLSWLALLRACASVARAESVARLTACATPNS